MSVQTIEKGPRDSAASPEPAPPVRSSRYGASCVGCRKRKRRCDGKNPTCGRCEQLKEKCVWEGSVRSLDSPHLAPLLSQTYQFLSSLIDPTASPPDYVIKSVLRQYLEKNPMPRFATGLLPGNAQVSESMSSPEGDGVQDPPEIDELLMHMSVANDGTEGHFGVTSLFWQCPSDPVLDRLRSLVENAHSRCNVVHPYAVDDTKSYAYDFDRLPVTQEQAQESTTLRRDKNVLLGWETLAFKRMELDYRAASSQVISHLIKCYFCWSNGIHCVVYRTLFIRDMALGGPYYNDFLLYMICAQGLRYSDHSSHSVGQDWPDFLALAKNEMSTEIDKVSTLQWGQYECASGNTSQGWLYTGMALRGCRDIGIHLDCSRLPIFGFGTLTIEDREVRRRLFWSAFTWDKIISLALGRMPTFNAHVNVSPGPIVDDSEDEIDWAPHWWQGYALSGSPPYSPRPSLYIANFRHFIRLCETIQIIIMNLYVGRPRFAGMGRFVQAMKSRLVAWFEELPSDLKLDTEALPAECPPPHVLTTNALYRAAWILLYRIFIPNTVPIPIGAPLHLIREASTISRQMAEETHNLFLLYTRSFGYDHMNLILTWSIYSAASVNASNFQSHSPEVIVSAGERLTMALHMLERSQIQVPSALRAVAIVKQRLRDPPVHHKRSWEESAGDEAGTNNHALLQESRAAESNSTEMRLWQTNTTSSSEFGTADPADETDPWSLLYGLITQDQQAMSAPSADHLGPTLSTDFLNGMFTVNPNEAMDGTWKSWI